MGYPGLMGILRFFTQTTRRWLPLAVLGACAVPSGAHDLPENRLRLVLREDNHIAATYFVNYTELMHRAFAPGKTYQEFAVQFASMDAAQFEPMLRQLDRQLGAETTVEVGGAVLHGTAGAFPSTAASQALIRKHVMGALTGSQFHEEPTEIDFDVIAPVKVASVQVRMPSVLGRVMVISYRPSQVFVEEGTASKGIEFH